MPFVIDQFVLINHPCPENLGFGPVFQILLAAGNHELKTFSAVAIVLAAASGFSGLLSKECTVWNGGAQVR